MHLDVFNTHMELYPYTKDDYPALEDLYTAVDKFSQKEFPCGYMIEDGKLFLPRGTPISKIEAMTKVKANLITESDPIEQMAKRFSSLYDPRDMLQEESIEFLINTPNPQLALNLKTGLGKTYCVAYSSSKINERTLIITPNEGLKQQWIGTYHKMFDYRPKHLINIAGSNVMEAIMEDLIEPADVYFVNHATLRSYMTTYNGYTLHKWFKKLKPGIKVYDEAHMEFANILLIDFFSNTARTWYLTATFDRSDKTESQCFKRAFNNLETYGEVESQAVVEKHVVYHIVNINSRATFEQKAKIIGYQGMSSISYGKYAFNLEDGNGARNGDHNNTAYRTISHIVDLVKGKEGKILIFVPLIAAVDETVDKLRKDHPEKKIMPYHSGISKDEKEIAEKKADIIVSTIKSTGTGKDIPGLRSVICAEPIASKVVAEQMVGRLRPYAKDVSTYFFDIVDVCLTPINWWLRARMKKIETLVKEVVNLNLDK